MRRMRKLPIARSRDRRVRSPEVVFWPFRRGGFAFDLLLVGYNPEPTYYEGRDVAKKH